MSVAIRPLFARALRKGDRVAVLSPSGPLRDRKRDLERGLARLRAWGLVPKVMPHALEEIDYPRGGELAGTDAHRSADLNAAFRDAELRAVFCIRGGYGVTRILNQLDFASLREDPIPIVGYSDVTALLAAARAEIGLVGLHGPMVATSQGFASGKANEELQRRLVTDRDRASELPRIGSPHVIAKGTAQGPLVGGNLSLVVSLIGTKWEIDTTGAIVFLEDIEEAPYRIDRMLTQLRQSGAFAKAAGVCLGDFHLKRTPLGSESPHVVRVFRDRLARLKIPVAHGFPFGHRPRSWTLPVGARARLDASDEKAEASLQLLEPAVK